MEERIQNKIQLQNLVSRKIGYGVVQPGDNTPGGVPVIKVKDIVAGLTSIEKLECTTTEIESSYSRTRLNGGEIVISIVGTIGKVRIVPESFKGANLVRATALIDIRDRMIANWVMYYIQSPKGQLYIRNNLNTTVQPTLNIKDLCEMEIPFYSELYMQKAVSILSTLDSRIELNNRINHNLEEQAQALYKSWFVDFDPFKDGKFIESELGMIPEGWRVGSIYEYAKVIYGAPYKSSLFNEVGDGLPLIRIRDLKDYSPQFYSTELLPNTEYVNKGDIVAGMDAEFTPYIWKGDKGLLNQRVCKFVPTSDSISRYYIMMMVKPELEFVSSYKVGTTVSHLGKSDIDRFTVLLPPVEVVTKYSDIVDSVLEQIINNATESARLTEQRDLLLPQLMSGKLIC